MNNEPKQMIDLHCHLPFGVSDGPKSIDESLAILRQAAGEGVTHITATAHYGQYYAAVCAAVEELKPEAERLGVSLYPAMEYDYVHLDEVSPDKLVFVGPESRYILLDFHRYRVPYSAPMRLFELQSQDISIIIVHPEKLFGTDMLPFLRNFSDAGMAQPKTMRIRQKGCSRPSSSR